MGLTRKKILQAVGCFLIGLQVLLVPELRAQQGSVSTYRNREQLRQFSMQRSENWEREKRKADSLAKAQDLPVRYREGNSRDIELQRLGFHNLPVYYGTDNADAARIISTDQLWTGEGGLPSVTGEGFEIHLWDGGAVLGTHREFSDGVNSRILMREPDLPVSNHSTHVAGTIGASGIDAAARGMANQVRLRGWDYNNDLAEMAIAASEGMRVSNHSYGPLCGWYFNSTTEFWYWYGDPALSAEEDYRFGFYDEKSADMDFIAWKAPRYLIVKSAGNDRNDAPPEQPLEHYVWDESWIQVSDVRDPDGGEDGYDCLSPMSVPKNILTVGAVDDDKQMTSFSAFGPTDDGRIKPDVVANGSDVYSSVALSDHSYDSYNGTSMSAASASGSMVLLYQLQGLLQPGVNLLSSTMKALVIHTADEWGSSPGPDYRAGWGLMDIQEAAGLIQANNGNGGRNILEGVLQEGQTVTIPLEVSEAIAGIRATLCWTDPPGELTEPSLDPVEARLVNDLNLELILPGSQTVCLPWVLDAAHPEEPATQGVNHLDNVEQLELLDPVLGSYQIRISHSGQLLEGSQSFSLIISGIPGPSDILPPRSLGCIVRPSGVELTWNAPDQGTPEFYRIYRNSMPLAEISDTSFTDGSATEDHSYTYYVTAVYFSGGDEEESVSTNEVTAIPRALVPLPLIIDFEDGYEDVIIRNSLYGWQWGDSETLSSYYLRFEENETQFIAADSYSNGKIAHVNDVAATLPLELGSFSEVILSFDYMLVSGIYDALDELHVLYKLQEDADWSELVQLPRAHQWTPYSLLLPDEICADGTQIGFYYDDLYLWGMGAALDNISMVGEKDRSLDLAITSLISPVSACSLSDAEPISIVISNVGEEAARPGDPILLFLEMTPDINIQEQVELAETLPAGEQLIYQMEARADLSETGSYSFEFHLSSELDQNPTNNSLSALVEARGYPEPGILNQDLLFCEEDVPVLMQCVPEGGILTGTGVSGFYFDPGAAGAGLHTLTYEFTDPEGCTGTASVEVEVIAQPEPHILNVDVSFCEDEPAVLIQSVPEGGILTGTGVDGSYFNPQEAGTGRFPVSYMVIYRGECAAGTSKDFLVYEKPVVDLGSDRKIELDDTLELIPDGNGVSYLWFNAATGNSLSIIANELGLGTHDIWVEAFSPEKCSAVDSMKLIIEAISGSGEQQNRELPQVYPNPFSTGFMLRMEAPEQVKNMTLFDLTGRIWSDHLPSGYPWFHLPHLPSGTYILRIEKGKQVYLIRIVKI